MRADLQTVTVAELVSGYRDDGEVGVVGYGGELDIRPPFQREFIYKGAQRDEVIRTVLKELPLNTMYWADRGEGESPRYEIIDGQQRTVSIAQYVNGDFSVDELYFHNQPADMREGIMAYPLTVYVCSGTESEKLDWFKIINIAGEELTDQELRNAVYCGPWTADAKGWFSRIGCPAQSLYGKYLKGSADRQDYLETAIKWASGGDIEEYMGRQQHNESAEPLWEHFRSVFDWVEATFTEYRSAMKGIDWGALCAAHGDDVWNPDEIEAQTRQLIDDEDVQSQKGIYPYILTGDEHHLNLRRFSPQQKQRAYQRQNGHCAACGEHFDIKETEADHIDPWSEDGKTVDGNCQVLCRGCNRRKGAK